MIQSRFVVFLLSISVFSLTSVTRLSVAQASKKALPPFEIIEDDKTGQDRIEAHQWYLDPLHVRDAWSLTMGDPSVVIAVVDSGVDYTYRDIQSSLWINPHEAQNNRVDDDSNGFIDDIIGWDFVSNRALPYDDNGHGTFIAGIIGAKHENGLGGKGICPDCRIMSLRFLDSEGLGDDEDSYRAIRYAMDNGASVINLSYAGEGYDDQLAKLIKQGAKKNILFVVAAGNDGDSNDVESTYPANFNYDNLITVGASDKNGGWWWRSNYSPKKVHVAAPGHEIWGPWNDKKWYKGSGTSFAAPIVSSIAAMMYTVNPQITPKQIKEILIQTSSAVAGFEDKVLSGGIVDAHEAVRCAKTLSCLK